MSKSTGSEVCFEQSEFSLYVFILICLFVYLVFILSKSKENMSNIDLNRDLSHKELLTRVDVLQEELYNCKLSKQKCDSNLQQITSELNTTQRQLLVQVQPDINPVQTKFLNKIYNPLYPPENVYSGGRFDTQGYNSYQQYQMIGYLSGSGDQYPVFARDKYPGRSDKQEYYTINESRNRIKIPFKTKNWNELYDGDTVDIPEIGSGLIFRKYDTNELRYDPDLF
jgi:hypothetical protein